MSKNTPLTLPSEPKQPSKAPISPLTNPIYVGTMGWNYPDWMGVFYPANTPLRDSLTAYSRTFSSVEIDSTFYGTPREAQVVRWHQMTPPDFVFCPKVPRLITHDMALKEVDAPLAEFLRVMENLKEKRGAILFQFPPTFTRADLPQLEALLPKLEELGMGGERFAMEFRHRSLIGEDVSALLSEHNIALASADIVNMPRRFEVTTDFIYMRLIGKHGAYNHHKHTQTDKSEFVERWAGVLRSQHERFERAYVFCNNDYEGYSPATCNRLKAALGLPVIEPVVEVQGSLFQEADVQGN